MRFVRRTFGFLVVCACFPVVLCWGAQSGRGPKGEVASILERAMDVQTDPALEGLQGRPKRASLIRKLIDENFLSSDMAAEALGDLWKDLGPPQKEEFTELFVELFQDSYTRMVLNFLRREELEYPEERVDGDKALVRTKIKRPNEHIPVDYHMVRKNGRWWIVDVDIDGVSIVGNYRNTFGRFLASQPLERLLERMRLQRQAVREAS